LGRDYNSLSDLTDVAAVRVTTYFSEDLNTVASKIEQEFNVDWPNSIDKRTAHEPDRFGYQSVHFVVSISEARCALAEYSRFRGFKLEIQVRSILQHAWAEIEHDLGYKSIYGVPRQVRRRFSRVAGLLELADEEFSGIRRELKNYAAAMPASIAARPENVGIDQISIRSLVGMESSVTHRLSADIANLCRRELLPPTDVTLAGCVRAFALVGLKTIADVERMAKLNYDIVIRYLKCMGGDPPLILEVHEDIGARHLAFALLSASPGKLYEYVSGFNLPDPHSYVQMQISIFEKLRQESAQSL